MTLLVPPEMQNLMNRLLAAIPGSENGGIAANKPGYHNSRENLPADDYSVSEYSDDQLGDSRYASAFDFTLQQDPAMMRKVTKRLVDAWVAKDPRLAHVRAFNGTVDSVNALRWDLANGPRTATYPTDDSHLWHVHVEVFRRWSNDKATMDAIYSVMTGQVLVVPPKEEDEEMDVLMRWNASPTVFITDCKVARPIYSEAELADVQTLYKEGSIKLGYGGKVRVVGRKSLIGRIVGPPLPGFEDQVF